MADLATKRPLFHSEADFQHAFAWQFHEVFPDAVVRLEYPLSVYPSKWIYLDLLLAVPEMQLAIELKYKTRSLTFLHSDENFYLKNHSAQDLGRYDFLKDVSRLEQIGRMRAGVQGYAILLTNEPSYWGAGRTGTVDENFRLYHGRSVSGELGWLAHASPGTTRNRTEIIQLSNTYIVDWKPFSNLPIKSGGEFRYLALKI